MGYTPNVGQKEDPLGGESSAYVQGKGDTKFIEIDKVQCAYRVFQFRGVDAANQKVLKKKWKIDVPGFSFLNNLAEEEPTLRNRDLKMGVGMGVPRVELRTRHLKRTPIPVNWTDLTEDDPAGGPTKKKDGTFEFPIGFASDSTNLKLEQKDGMLTFEVFAEEGSDDDEPDEP